jgi:two-component system phosphate regulon response regulator PhoB
VRAAATAAVIFDESVDDGPGHQPPSGCARLRLAGETRGRGEGAATRVLVVEDDASMRLLCRFNLGVAGFDVVVAATGEEALAAAEAGRFDLVLLDVMLPDFSGIEVARRLRRGVGRARLPIVFVSARGSEEDLERGRVAGAIDYIVKPFDPVALPQRLRDDLEELGRTGAAGVWRLRFGRGHDGT